MNIMDNKKSVLKKDENLQEELNIKMSEALNELDTELLETIELVSKISYDEKPQVNYIITTNSGTCSQNNTYAE